MKIFEKKQRIRRALYSTPLLIVLLIITILLVRGTLGIMGKEIESRNDSKNLERKAKAMVIRESEIRENIRRLETEEGIKDEIRKKFNVTQEGEFVAIIVDDRRASTSTDSSNLPWYKKFLDAIMSFYE